MQDRLCLYFFKNTKDATKIGIFAISSNIFRAFKVAFIYQQYLSDQYFVKLIARSKIHRLTSLSYIEIIFHWERRDLCEKSTEIFQESRWIL